MPRAVASARIGGGLPPHRGALSLGPERSDKEVTRSVEKTKDPRRVVTGRIGALRLHGLHDGRTLTTNGRTAFLRRFRDEAAAAAAARGEEITDEELERRAGYLRQHHFALMAYNREKARKNKKTARADETPAVTEVAGGTSTVLHEAS